MLLLYPLVFKSVPMQQERDQRARSVQICEQIKEPLYALSDNHIEAFLDVARISGRCTQDLAPTLFQSVPEQYGPYSTRTTDGIQIIYEGTTNKRQLKKMMQRRKKNIGSQEIELGHFVCVHYVLSQQTVYIYDSLHKPSTYVDNPSDRKRRINARTREIIQILYPDHLHRIAVRPQTRQPDGRSCGKFAAAYATTLLFGRIPATYQLSLTNSRQPGNNYMKTDLRFHMAIIQNNQLALFPSP